MVITIVIVNLCGFFGANYDSYEKFQQLESNKQFFRRGVHATKNLFIIINSNNNRNISVL